MRIHIPANYPPEWLVLFVISTWQVLIALLISRAGVLSRAGQRSQIASAEQKATASLTAESA